jgi:ATP-binding cassette subfamily F protein 3
MAPSESEIKEACAELLKGLDEDTLEYVAGGLLDDEDGTVLEKDDLVDFVVPMLEEMCGGDEDAARAKAESLWDRLTAGSAAAPPAPVAAPEKRAPISLGGGPISALEAKTLAEAAAAREAHAAPEVLYDHDVGGTTSAAAEKEAARAAARRALLAETAAAEAAELASELEAACERAARMRIDGDATGSRLAAIELGPFQLPNPGGGADLLDDAVLTLAPGHRYGLIGRNGKGKSTLLKFIASRRVGGLAADVSVHYVTQEVTLTDAQEDALPAEVVLQADVERRLLLLDVAEMEAQEALDDKAFEENSKISPEQAEARRKRLATAHERLLAMDAEGAPSRASALLRNLGFSDALASRKMRALSGGWRVRVALAAALFAKPDVLLLDEPTNHLSVAAVLWLARELSVSKTWRTRAVVVVSHDRHFLDAATTDSLHISGAARRLTAHRMCYSAWAAKRAEQQLALERRRALRDEKKKTLEGYAGHGFKYGGSSSQINMMQRKANEALKLDEEARKEADETADLAEDAELPLRLSAGGTLRGPFLARLEKVSFRYPAGDKTLFANVDMTLDSASRVCLLGENGEGKTTLVKVLLGQLEPTAGVASLDRGARVALVNQHHADQLAFDKTPLAFMLEKFPGDGGAAHEREVRAHLASVGVSAAQQGTPSGALSGGQRSRVALAATSFAKPHLLVLDEPTNNLDLEAVAALADAVERFEGGVVLVSHDQYFVQRVARDVYVVGNGAVTKQESFQAYRAAMEKTLED